MHRAISIECCPQCGQTHRYLLKVSQVPARETGAAAMRNRLFRCPETQSQFEWRLSLDPSARQKILEVKVLRLLVEGEEASSAETAPPATVPVTEPATLGSDAAPDDVASSDYVTRVFVSYSRRDEQIVTPIVQIMRAVGMGVFQDIDSIPFGKRWRPVIELSIQRATVVVVFWCDHARGSVEVRKEWEQAIRDDKSVVPMLLDNTPLEGELADFQSVDLRALAATHCEPAGQGPGMLPNVLGDSHVSQFAGEATDWAAKRLLEHLARQFTPGT